LVVGIQRLAAFNRKSNKRYRVLTIIYQILYKRYRLLAWMLSVGLQPTDRVIELTSVEKPVNATDALYDEIYSPEVVMARVGHLDRGRRHDIERITRIIREGFDGAGVLHPRPKITQILLTGAYARRIWSESASSAEIPTYEFWVIVSNRLFTHRKLWQVTEAKIAQELEGRSTVELSFRSSAGFKAGRRSGDEYVRDRLTSSIMLYRAKRDDPQLRRASGAAIWAEAVARFDDADTAFLPASHAFREAERAYFSARADRAGTVPAEDDQALQIAVGLDIAIVEEQRLGGIRHEALLALLHTPAPNLAAVIRKVELVYAEGDNDDHAVVSILSDLRWIARRIANCGQPS
jgi:hypothetical protein